MLTSVDKKKKINLSGVNIEPLKKAAPVNKNKIRNKHERKRDHRIGEQS